LTLVYESIEDLKAFGISLNNDKKFSMTNFLKSHIKSEDGILDEGYWTFEANKPFSFSLAPLTDMPEEYQKFKKSLLPFWKTIKH
jgi:hypothetical protein